MNEEYQENTETKEGVAVTEGVQADSSANSILETELSVDSETSKNTIIVAVLAIIVVVLTLMYIWGAGIDKEITEDALIEAELQAPLPPDESIEALQKVQTSDEMESIEADLSATDVDTLDADLRSMEAELNKE